MRARQRSNFLLPRLIAAGVTFAAGMLAVATGCDPRMSSVVKRLKHTEVVRYNRPPERDARRLRVATFNLDVFGVSKLQNAKASGVLADVIRQFDVVAVQEIRASDQSVLDEFIQLVNLPPPSQGLPGQYDYVLGPRLGRTDSKEQYAFLYDRGRVEVDPQNVYTLVDDQDLLHRQPFVARFAARVDESGERPFTFTLVNIHTDPDVAQSEVDLLDDVLQVVRNDGSGEDDVILLGDLNRAPAQFGELSRVTGIQWVVENLATNTRGSETYDNILFLPSSTVEYAHQYGVFNFRDEYKLSSKEALEVSDHFPVWAEFYAREGSSQDSWAQANRSQLTR